MTDVVTPVNIDRFEQLLQQAGYEKEKTRFLIKGLREGFSIGYEGRADVQIHSPNLKFRGVGDKTVLWNKVMKEVKLKRYAGPFPEVPFKNFIQSPIGLVPKDNGRDVRLIFHLSYPRGTGTSVNANTPKNKCSVKYPDFDKAIQLCLACLEKAGVCFLGKSDMSAAFRNLGIKPEHWKYLVMMAVSPIDGKKYYFFDKCLPFRAAISCAIFQCFSNAVAFLVEFKTGEILVNYLDDYLFVAILKSWCNQQIQCFLAVCQDINFPVSMEKTEWGNTIMVFLGMLIDARNRIVSVPVDKVHKALDLLRSILNKRSRKLTLKQLQKICGFLNFLGRAIVPGRAFTRRLYSYTKGHASLKAHHHIRISLEMRKDLEMWLEFMEHPSIYSRGFMDFGKTWLAEEIQMHSDAAKKWQTRVCSSVPVFLELLSVGPKIHCRGRSQY